MKEILVGFAALMGFTGVGWVMLTFFPVTTIVLCIALLALFVSYIVGVAILNP